MWKKKSARIKAAFKFPFFPSSLVFKASVENFLFLLLQGGGFDNIGYARWVYVMLHDAFPFVLAKDKIEGRLMGNSTLLLLEMSKVKFLLHLLLYVDLTPCPTVGFDKCCFDWMPGKWWIHHIDMSCSGIPSALLSIVQTQAGPQCALTSAFQLWQGVGEQDVPQHLWPYSHFRGE